MQKRNLLYYLFTLFIIAIFLWWWALLFQKNENVYAEKLVLYDLIVDIDTSETTLKLYNQEVISLNEQYKRQKAMITWEGLTFLFLLILGIVRLNQYFQKEIALARQQSNFLLSITHELKSPLASALLNIQTLQKRQELDNDKRQRLLSSSRSELSRLEELVGKLLFAARIEGGPISHDMVRVDISSLYKKLFADFKEKYADEFTIVGAIENGIQVLGDHLLLTSVFINLSHNATKYCPAGGEISIELKQEASAAMLAVANNGPSIEAREKEKIWDKFYRIGDEHTRSSTGTGLGLYIVRKVVESHQGNISVKDREGGGVIFTASIPVTAQ